MKALDYTSCGGTTFPPSFPRPSYFSIFRMSMVCSGFEYTHIDKKSCSENIFYLGNTSSLF